jgi:phosphohistidine swiveling domain-containing protein
MGSNKMKKLLETIKKKRWFFGTRRDESLLFNSMKTKGEAKYLPKFGLPYVDRLLVLNKKNQSIRALDAELASRLHGIMRDRVLDTPQILSEFIKRDHSVLKNLVLLSGRLDQEYRKSGRKENQRLFEKIYDLYALHSTYVYICFAAGVQLSKNVNQARDIITAKKAIKDHNKWRNFITFPEEEFGKNIFGYLSFELKKLSIKPIRDYNYLDIEEILDFLKNHKNKNLAKKIKERKNGFIFLAFSGNFEIITDKHFIQEIKNHLAGIEKNKKMGDELKGQTAFGRGKTRGQVLKILDIKKFSGSLKNKILVAVQTTPYFVPYIKGAKAILTDEGGITCHAAIISREMKIPCVVGIKEATRKLKTDDLIEVNLDNGTIKVKK